ncbi:hypothetical protein TREMEDRAFT_22970, partial [Tremella mesenterica DSM 1558]|uniref:uncharacterized protein n=1 Tax=Tremella mesenterica (strain ATCC 24925 / CBS 8224 / DSM 1558 / NBRC 9311 / NRRL Y-6157 / RJB 2259-6 / UBC 559-6) TaxID=578456 RepID=UPI0003F48F10
YSATHAHPAHIEIPPSASAPRKGSDDMSEALDSPIMHTPSSSRPPPAKGILKNAVRRPSGPLTGDERQGGSERNQDHLTWDEEMIALQEIEKQEEQRMKIDEPKTPFVRYDALNDVVLSGESFLSYVPKFDLEQDHPPRSPSTPRSSAPGTPSTTSSHPRRPSSSSSTSSRSTSFSLPNHPGIIRPGPRSTSPAVPAVPGPKPSAPQARSGELEAPISLGATHANTAANAGEVFTDSDEEDKSPEAIAHREAFKRMRKGHYANEADAIARAKALMEKEEESMNVDG